MSYPQKVTGQISAGQMSTGQMSVGQTSAHRTSHAPPFQKILYLPLLMLDKLQLYCLSLCNYR